MSDKCDVVFWENMYSSNNYRHSPFMSSDQSSKSLKTPDKGGIQFPSGHILVNERWRKDELVRELSKRGRVVYSDALGFVDFYLNRDCPVLYITESDMKMSMKETKDKISKLKCMNYGKVFIVAIWNRRTLSEFNDIQELAVLDFGLFVVPVSSQSEVPTVLHKLAMHEIRSPQNIKKGLKSAPTAVDQISVLTKIPGVGEEEAKLILQRFGNIISVCEASKESLKCTIGERLAAQVFKFFNNSIT